MANNYLKGGKSEGMTLSKVAKLHNMNAEQLKPQLKKGIKHELEHTDSVVEARRIALDHLVEFSNYYDRLDKIEKMHLGGDMSQHLAPNGKPSNLTHEQWHIVRTPEFKAWFGDWENDPKNASKVVDENGEPLVVYHGTWVENPFDVFDFDKADLGFHFGTYQQAKNRVETKMSILHRGRKPIIKPYFLNIKTLFDASDIGEWQYPQRYIDMIVDGNIITENEAKTNGFFTAYYPNDNKTIRDFIINKHGGDVGFVYENKYEAGGQSYIVLQESQIKLADGTNTTFDSKTPDIRFANGGLIAPNGKESNLTPEQYKLVRTKAFKDWFGDWENDPKNASKVVDENGEPLVLFHNTDKVINIFRVQGKIKTLANDIDNYGVYFSKKNEYVSFKGNKIYACFLRILNPYIVQDQFWSAIITQEKYQFILENDFDGVILNRFGNDFYAETIVFRSNQIKLADGTNTTFDGNNPDIRFANGGLIAPNGKESNLTPEQYKLVRTKAFKDWFGDWENDPKNASKVVDENGEPLVVYRGSKSKNPNYIPHKHELSNGIYFSTKKEVAELYTTSVWQNWVGRVFECFLNIRNLDEYDTLQLKSNIYQADFDYYNKIVTTSYENKFDGIRWDNFIDVPDLQNIFPKEPIDFIATTFIVFEPTQIKLADGTNTTFDGNNADIRFANGGEIDETAQMYIDIISMNPTLEKYQKYKDILKREYDIDFDSIYKDNEYIENANLQDIKSQSDFLDFDNWLKYAKKISMMRGFVRMDDYMMAFKYDVTDDVWKRMSDKLDFRIEKVPYIETTTSGDIARVMGNTLYYTEHADLYYLLHEIGHIYDFQNNVSGIIHNPAYSPTHYGTMNGGETFAENFAIYFINPIALKNWDKDVYDEMGNTINPKYKYELSSLVSEFIGERLAKGGLIAPNGKESNLTPEQYKLVRTKAFKDWFGDWENDPKNASKVVDENGEPLVVYRGDSSESKKGFIFKKGFNRMGFINKDRLPNQYFHYFVNNYDVARGYAQDQIEDHNDKVKRTGKGKIWGKKVTPYFLNIRNPIDITPNNPSFPTFEEFENELKNQLRKEWFERERYRNAWDYGKEVSDSDLNKIFEDKLGKDYLEDNYISKWQKEGFANGKTNKDSYQFFIEFKNMNSHSDILNKVVRSMLEKNVDGLVFLELTHWDDGFWRDSKKYESGELKYDYKRWVEKPKVFATLNSEQIKLADGTNTTFDGENPDIRYKRGGRTIAQTPAPKSDRVYGSKTNPKGSASDSELAKSIKFNDNLEKAIENKVIKYNDEHPMDKVRIQTAKAVVRRGMGAYSKSHRPTISGGAPNSRQAWGLARLNKFLLKKSGVKVKSAYIQDDDLLKYAKGGQLQADIKANAYLKPSNCTDVADVEYAFDVLRELDAKYGEDNPTLLKLWAKMLERKKYLLSKSERE